MSAEVRAIVVSSPYLESIVLGACPELREPWQARRRTFAGGDPQTDGELLDAARRHVVGLLVAGRVAEFARFTRTIERVLGEADPMLFELLREGLLRPLARDVRDAGVADAHVVPHLGVRTALAWPAA